MATASSSSGIDQDHEQRRRGSPLSERSQASVEDDDLAGPNPTRDALAEGIVSLLSPTLNTLDQGVLATKRSQEELSEQIALLTDQLKLISAEQACPIDLDGYVTRLGTIKGKINVISSVLHAAQERLNKVHEQAIKEAARRKPLIEPSPVVTSPTYSTPAGAASQEGGQAEATVQAGGSSQRKVKDPENSDEIEEADESDNNQKS